MTEYIGEYYTKETTGKILRLTDGNRQQDKQIDIEREKGLLPEKTVTEDSNGRKTEPSQHDS